MLIIRLISFIILYMSVCEQEIFWTIQALMKMYNINKSTQKKKKLNEIVRK
jgi:hypothetical protein